MVVFGYEVLCDFVVVVIISSIMCIVIVDDFLFGIEYIFIVCVLDLVGNQFMNGFIIIVNMVDMVVLVWFDGV